MLHSTEMNRSLRAYVGPDNVHSLKDDLSMLNSTQLMYSCGSDKGSRV